MIRFGLFFLAAAVSLGLTVAASVDYKSLVEDLGNSQVSFRRKTGGGNRSDFYYDGLVLSSVPVEDLGTGRVRFRRKTGGKIRGKDDLKDKPLFLKDLRAVGEYLYATKVPKEEVMAHVKRSSASM